MRVIFIIFLLLTLGVGTVFIGGHGFVPTASTDEILIEHGEEKEICQQIYGILKHKTNAEYLQASIQPVSFEDDKVFKIPHMFDRFSIPVWEDAARAEFLQDYKNKKVYPPYNKTKLDVDSFISIKKTQIRAFNSDGVYKIYYVIASDPISPAFQKVWALFLVGNYVAGETEENFWTVAPHFQQFNQWPFYYDGEVFFLERSVKNRLSIYQYNNLPRDSRMGQIMRMGITAICYFTRPVE